MATSSGDRKGDSEGLDRLRARCEQLIMPHTGRIEDFVDSLETLQELYGVDERGAVRDILIRVEGAMKGMLGVLRSPDHVSIGLKGLKWLLGVGGDRGLRKDALMKEMTGEELVVLFRRHQDALWIVWVLLGRGGDVGYRRDVLCETVGMLDAIGGCLRRADRAVQGLRCLRLLLGPGGNDGRRRDRILHHADCWNGLLRSTLGDTKETAVLGMGALGNLCASDRGSGSSGSEQRRQIVAEVPHLCNYLIQEVVGASKFGTPGIGAALVLLRNLVTESILHHMVVGGGGEGGGDGGGGGERMEKGVVWRRELVMGIEGIVEVLMHCLAPISPPPPSEAPGTVAPDLMAAQVIYHLSAGSEEAESRRMKLAPTLPHLLTLFTTHTDPTTVKFTALAIHNLLWSSTSAPPPHLSSSSPFPDVYRRRETASSLLTSPLPSLHFLSTTQRNNLNAWLSVKTFSKTKE